MKLFNLLHNVFVQLLLATIIMCAVMICTMALIDAFMQALQGHSI